MKQQIVFLCLILVLGTKAAPEPKIDTFIVNGTLSTGSPSYALVTYTNAQGLGFFGGGCVISTTHVLTAAHVIFGFATWNIGVGASNLNTLLRVTTINAVAHPSFNANNRANDIGIITLQSPLPLSPTIQPIALPQLNQVAPFDYEQGRIFGFGFLSEGSPTQSQNLQVTFQRVTNHTQCLAAHPSILVGQQFCANDLTRLSNICLGDYGGGLIVPYRGVDLLVGIGSLTLQQCNTISPALYTRVSNYRAWIRQITAI